MPGRPLWRCPECGRRFANRNQWHSCGRFSVRDHLRGKPREVVALYRRFMHLLRGTGSFRLHPVKTRIGVTSRMTFAEIVLKRRGLDGHLLLPRRVESPRFTKIVSGSPRVHVHSFRLRSLGELDEEFEGWLHEAASVGRQEHLDTPILSPHPSPRPAAEGRAPGAAPRKRRPGRR